MICCKILKAFWILHSASKKMQARTPYNLMTVNFFYRRKQFPFTTCFYFCTRKARTLCKHLLYTLGIIKTIISPL